MRFFLPRPGVDWSDRKHPWLVFLCDHSWLADNTARPHEMRAAYLLEWLQHAERVYWREVDAEEFRRWVDGC